MKNCVTSAAAVDAVMMLTSWSCFYDEGRVQLPIIIRMKRILLICFVAFVVTTEIWTSQTVHLSDFAFDRDCGAPDTHAANGSTVRLMQPKEQTKREMWNLHPPRDAKEIRKWGCNLTETPLIFVHIGKS